MRSLTLHQALPPEQVADRIAFLVSLNDGENLPPEQARFILAVVRQYENQGLTWQELVSAAYVGLRGAIAHQSGAPSQNERLGIWPVRQHVLRALALRNAVSSSNQNTSRRGPG